MKITRYLLAPALALLFTIQAGAQSKSFSFGKWVEIHNAILSELNLSYVDSLPVDRIERAAVDAMLSSLDPYTVYVPAEELETFNMSIGKAYGGIGAIIYKPDKDGNVIINEPYEGSPASRSGLTCGDEILTIDGVSTHGLTSSECSEKMRGKPGTTVTFLVKKLRSGQTTEVKVTRERIHLPDVEYAGILDDGKTGYILQTGFTEGVGEAIKQAYIALKKQGMETLILDLRGNGGGLLGEAINIVSLFVPRGSVVVTSRGHGTEETVFKTTKDPIDTVIPIKVLVDSGSASASEIVSGALQDYDRATILGHRTFGKGLVQSIRELPYGGELKLTTAKYYTPSGRCVQAIDYSSRNEDGSVRFIPDSLTHEFKTAHGRTVRDGGGVTPDDTLSAYKYSRLTYSLVMNGIVEDYTLKYVREHPSIPAVDDFHFTEYDDFVEFAAGREFDYRSSAKTYFDQMKKELREDGLADEMSDEIAALEKALNMEKEAFLRLKKDEIIPFIEEEIAVRYYFQKAGIKVRIRYDRQLAEAMKKPFITY
ncbi:MAG: S41 family peptidase [Bacteroidales bacterium]|nr:S41 family peptidase [Bacteroidales bacterium]